MSSCVLASWRARRRIQLSDGFLFSDDVLHRELDSGLRARSHTGAPRNRVVRQLGIAVRTASDLGGGCQSPVGLTPAGSTITTTVRRGALVLCITLRGTE